MWGQLIASMHGFHSPAFWNVALSHYVEMQTSSYMGIWISTSSRFLYNRILAPHEPSIEVRNVQGYKVTIVNKSLPPDRARKASTFILAEKQQYASDL